MKIELRDVGVMEYNECWALQREFFDELLAHKGQQIDPAGVILLVEHPHVYTLGKSGRAANMLLSDVKLTEIGAQMVQIDRGGDITYHGFGQLVVYPILDLERLGLSLRDYIDLLEQVVIEVARSFGIEAHRDVGASGVWIGDGVEIRKLCAVGVRASRYVTMHGLALNVATDLSYFRYINPCGFVDRGVASIESELARMGAERCDAQQLMAKVKELFVTILEEKLDVKIYKN